MGCHGQLWLDSPQLAPVRASWINGTAIGWKRVYDLPDHVYFNHRVHVSGAGVPCARCHGQVDAMPRVSRETDMTMGWCLDCHRNPPGSLGFSRRITPLTTCSACHR
jgi:hypothetical protein